jgi:hypothetical protein
MSIGLPFASETLSGLGDDFSTEVTPAGDAARFASDDVGGALAIHPRLLCNVGSGGEPVAPSVSRSQIAFPVFPAVNECNVVMALIIASEHNRTTAQTTATVMSLEDTEPDPSRRPLVIVPSDPLVDCPHGTPSS